MSKYKSLLIKTAVSLVIGLLMVLATLWLRDFSQITVAAERMKALADAFTIPGVVFLMVGVLVWVSSTGFFDFLGFAFGNLGRALVPMSKKPHQTYYDYKVGKSGKRASGFSAIFITGAILTIVAVVFTVLYYNV